MQLVNKIQEQVNKKQKHFVEKFENYQFRKMAVGCMGSTPNFHKILKRSI